MGGLFGTSGVRGYTNSEITPQLAMNIGAAVGALIGSGKKACTGRDTRFGSHMLELAAGSGLMSQGLDVTECGVVPTPVLAYMVREEADCGIMVTGSHLPPHMVGIIPLLDDGAYLPDEQAKYVEESILSRAFLETRVDTFRLGELHEAVDCLSRYRDKVLSTVDSDLIARNRFRVAVDPANGTACGFLADILGSIGCDVVEIHGTPSGIPGRSPEPRASTLADLCAVIRENSCDFGAGLDTDADRVVFVDEKGTPVSEDVMGVIFADYVFAEQKGVFVTPVNSSGIVEWFSRTRDVELEYCKIGQPATVEAIKRVGAVYSYEESGKYYFAKEVNWCDGLLATLKLLEILAINKATLSQLVNRYPQFYQVKQTVELPPEKRDVIMSLIKNRVLSTPGENHSRVVDIDGYKLVYPDDSWLLLRASGTEPVLRVYSDSPDRKRAENLVKKGIELVNEIVNSRIV
jgi:phosphomannomutase/phosphoglucomutase